MKLLVGKREASEEGPKKPGRRKGARLAAEVEK